MTPLNWLKEELKTLFFLTILAITALAFTGGWGKFSASPRILSGNPKEVNPNSYFLYNARLFTFSCRLTYITTVDEGPT